MASATALRILTTELGLAHYLEEIRRFPMLERREEYMQCPDLEVPIQFERGRRGCGGRSARWSPGYRRLTWSSGAALGSRCVD